MCRLLLSVLVVCLLLGAARAQQSTDLRTLLQNGYEVKAAYSVSGYSRNTVLFLQNGASLYVCLVSGADGGALSGFLVGQAYCEPV
jgi:hypothetical protein